jgi:alpha-methylacyl-CoA racemase
MATGPLAGVRIVELAGIGPSRMCATFLADLGATVIRVDRKQPSGLGVEQDPRFELNLRNRKAIRVDLKDPAGVALALDLVEKADALIEGYRPGVAERLGLGPQVCLARNPNLVYGRATGWGQEGPLAHAAGHDINYIAITGALSAIGRQGQPPSVPLSLLGDYAGGALFLALGIVSAILEARGSGQGQVVDGAVVDGVASLMTVQAGLRQGGLVGAERGTNLFDSGAPFYDTYECADGKYVAVGPVEPKFFAQLLERIGLDADDVGDPMDKSRWPRAKALIGARLKTRTRDEWAALLGETDVCLAPVLDLQEAYAHPHLKARGTYVEVDGVMQPAASPRFSRTPAGVPRAPAPLTTDNARDALRGWLDDGTVDALAAAGTFI